MTNWLRCAASLLFAGMVLTGCGGKTTPSSSGSTGLSTTSKGSTTSGGSGISTAGATASSTTSGGHSTGTTGAGGTGAGSAYAPVVMADSPLAYYRLDELSGSVANDHSGNGHTATYGANVALGTASLLTTDPDPAAGFNGGAAQTANYVTAPSAQALEPTSAISLECWIKPAATATTQIAIASYGEDAAAPYQPYILRQDGTGLTFQLVLGSTAGSTMTALTSQTPLQAGQVHHVVGTYDGQTMSLYVDGSLNASQAATGAISNYAASSNGLGIGHRYTSTEPVFDGTIDEVAIYGMALSAARVLAHYEAGGGHPGSSSASNSSGATASTTAGSSGTSGSSTSSTGAGSAGIGTSSSGSSTGWAGTSSGTTSSTDSPPPQAVAAGYTTPVLIDDFTTDTINGPGFGGTYPNWFLKINSGIAPLSPSQYSIGDGSLIIDTDISGYGAGLCTVDNSSSAGAPALTTPGAIASANQYGLAFRFGYFEATLAFDTDGYSGTGNCPAFWLSWCGYGPSASNGDHSEIDLLEAWPVTMDWSEGRVGPPGNTPNPAQWSSTVLEWVPGASNGTGVGSYQGATLDFSTPHTLGALWTSDGLQVFWNDVLVSTIPISATDGEASQVNFNNLILGTGFDWPLTVSSVHVWQ